MNIVWKAANFYLYAEDNWARLRHSKRAILITVSYIFYLLKYLLKHCRLIFVVSSLQPRHPNFQILMLSHLPIFLLRCLQQYEEKTQEDGIWKGRRKYS